MTYKESICVLCANLSASEKAVCVNDGKRNLISECLYGGKNAGNRKKCKKFRQAKPEIVTKRIGLLDKKVCSCGERKDNG